MVRYPRFRAVVFDCDSTLISVEGIDELAGPHTEAVRRLTEQAMEGLTPLEEVYGRRLELIAPTREQIDALGRLCVEHLVEGARETVARLRAGGVDVRIVSGGLRPAVLAVARELGVPDERVAAVDLYFDGRGRYADFERGSPLARSGGKAEVLREWALPRPSLMVGDGMTDLEARPVVDAFAAFTSVVERPVVVEAADHHIRRMQDLHPLVLGHLSRAGASS